MIDVLRVLTIENQSGDEQQIKTLLEESVLAGRLPNVQPRLETVKNFTAALACLEKETFDVLLTKISSPKDLHTISDLRTRHPALHVIVRVSDENESLALLALTQGASDFLIGSSLDSHSLSAVFRHAVEYVRFHASQYRLSWLEENISEVVWRAKPDLHFTEMTPSITRLTGFSPDDALKSNLIDWIVPDFRQYLQEALSTLYSSEPDALALWHTALEVEHLRKDGSAFWVELSLHTVVGADGKLTGIVGATRDVSARHAIQEKLDFISMHDPLTGLFNRAYFLEELKRLEFSRLYPITIMMADLEGLKAVNVQYGLAVGDEVIKRTSTLLRSAFRMEDLVARIGGDEFVAIMPHTNQRAGERALQRVVNMIETENEKTSNLPLNLSVGIATAEHGQSLMDTIKVASAQKLNEKNSG